jgi:nitrile hydratase
VAAYAAEVDGIHDMGGMHGFGPVPYRPDDGSWHDDDWEPRAMVVSLLTTRAAGANLDRFRHAIERLPPDTYLTVGYFGRWIRAARTVWDEVGAVPFDPAAPRTSARPAGPPGRFAVGDRVVTRRDAPAGHTRLPRYCRGMVGEVAAVHGTYVFPDTNAHGEGERPQAVYAVRFAATDLWGDGAEPSTFVHVDLYDDYLDPAATP